MLARELFEQAGRRLAGWQRAMILSHDRPDGDALGAMAAMKRVIEAAGRQATAFVYDALPSRYAFMADFCTLDRWQAEEHASLDAKFDGILLLDTNSWSQLKPVADYLKASSLPRIVVDHHASGDHLPADRPGDIHLIDPVAAATCDIVHNWFREMGWPIDTTTAEALFTGLATDTGWFRHSNTNAQALLSAANLVHKGVRPDVFFARLYGAYPLARVRLMGEMLNTLTVHADGAVAVAWLTPEVFQRAGASTAETEDLVNEPLLAAPVIVSVLLTDSGSGEIRVSFRSKSPEVCGLDIDVAALAGRFGGGGHRRAAGARITGPLEVVRDQVTAAALAVLTG